MIFVPFCGYFLLGFQDPQRFLSFPKTRIQLQRHFDLALRLIETIHLGERDAVVESRGGKVRLEPERQKGILSLKL